MIDRAAHILANRYPELTNDDVSRYVARLREKLGDARCSAVYSTACRSAPVGENPMGLQRGSVVEIEGERYLALGSGFLTLEFASLARPNQLRSIGPDEFARLQKDGFTVLPAEESRQIVDQALQD